MTYGGFGGTPKQGERHSGEVGFRGRQLGEDVSA